MNGNAINSIISVWNQALSLLSSSNLNSPLSNKDFGTKKVWKDAN